MPTPVHVWLPGDHVRAGGARASCKVVELSYQKAKATKGEVKGNIPILDIQYGNVWSNISDELLNQAGIKLNDTLCVTISEGSQQNTQGKCRMSQASAMCRKASRWCI